MSTEELLRKRYEVIADYPDSRLRIGDILEDGSKDYEWWINSRDQSKWTFAPQSYPAIFKPLQWWERREVNEMTKYVKTGSGNRIAKARFDMQDTSAYFMFLDHEVHPYSPSGWFPATEEEYNKYINSKK